MAFIEFDSVGAAQEFYKTPAWTDGNGARAGSEIDQEIFGRSGKLNWEFTSNSFMSRQDTGSVVSSRGALYLFAA